MLPSRLRSCLVPFLLVALGSVHPAAQDLQRSLHEMRTPFERLADTGERGVVTLAFDLEDHALFFEAHAAGAALRLTGFPLPGSKEVDLVLRPVRALEPGARAVAIQADGSHTWLEPRVASFAGSVESADSGVGQAFLGITPTQLHGYFTLGGETYFLSSGGQVTSGRATLAHGSKVGAQSPGFCRLATAPSSPGSTNQRSSPLSVRSASVFIEADNAYRALFASDQDCLDYSALLASAASEIYRRDLGVELNIPSGYLRIWNTTPPWGTIVDFNGIYGVQAWWSSSANPDQNLPRAAVHVLTNPVFGGVAWNVGGLCDNTQGYGVSSVFGSFPYPIQHTSASNWDLFVLCHEFGHTFGSIHSFDFSPPIECSDGSGPDLGTIMSYCHLSFGVGGVGMRFHEREQQLILAYSGGLSCFTDIPIASGDYDHDGDRDLVDLAAADQVLGQGFTSLGARATFDMDLDGDFDALDRDILAALIAGGPPASATPRNGAGVNSSCYFSLTNPVLGSTWSSQVLALGAGRLTYVLVYDQPFSGVFTLYGELLVRTRALGGRFLFRHAASSSGVFADHDIAVPLDPALVGLSAATQALVLGGAGGPELCNAIDLVLSLYE